jgi:hypothetical protein
MELDLLGIIFLNIFSCRTRRELDKDSPSSGEVFAKSFRIDAVYWAICAGP